jgi:two-component system cell cycle response regulator DivK
MKTAVSIRPEDASVIVVEDNFQNFVLITRLLAYLGVKDCEWKASGWQVLEFAESLSEVDLILMDIFLPEADGYEALDTLRNNSRFEDTLIVAVTADASVENMQRAQAAGFDGFIGKPLDPDRFPDQIRRVLQGEAVWEIE